MMVEHYIVLCPTIKEFRSALLINVLQKDIIEDVKLLDNNTDKIKT